MIHSTFGVRKSFSRFGHNYEGLDFRKSKDQKKCADMIIIALEGSKTHAADNYECQLRNTRLEYFQNIYH